jgi:hypothetical protein
MKASTTVNEREEKAIKQARTHRRKIKWFTPSWVIAGHIACTIRATLDRDETRYRHDYPL